MTLHRLALATAAFCCISPSFAITTGGISTDCGDMTKAVPAKIGNSYLVQKDCATILAEAAKNMHSYPGRYIIATYDSKSSKRSIIITLKDQRNDPMQDLKGNPEVIAQTKDADKTLAEAAAKGGPQMVAAYKDLHAHVRVAPLTKPDEAVVKFHDDPTALTAEVQGAVFGTVLVIVNMDATDIDSALNSLNQINSLVNYAVMH